MDKQIWINAGLLLFIAVLATVVFYSPEEPVVERTLITAIDHSTIKQITIIREHLDDLTFSKVGDDKWLMESPLQYVANSALINTLLGITKAESHGQLDATLLELAQFDLKAPTATLTLDDYHFLFGNTDPISQRRYILFKNTNTVHLADDIIHHQLTISAAAYADTRLLPVDTDITAVIFADKQLKLVNNEWQAIPPLVIAADQIKRMVSSWKNARAISVSDYKAADKISPIIISTKDGGAIEFVIVSKAPYLILGRADMGIQYHMGSDDAERLLLKESAHPIMPVEATESM